MRRWLTSLLESPWSTPGPTVGVEIAGDYVAAVAVERGGDRVLLSAHAIEALPPGAVEPTVSGPNIAEPSVVVEALRQVFGRIERRPKRVALVVPDSVAKVAIVKFEQVPSRPEELEELLRWQVRKTAPFRIEDAQVSATPGARTAAGEQEFVVALARRDIIEEYERACAGAGSHAGLVDLASFDLIDAVMVGGTTAGDWLLVHVTAQYSTLAIVREGHLIFFRNRPAEGEGNLSDLVHQTAMYYEDRLAGAGFGHVFLVAAPGQEVDAISQGLEERLSIRVERVNPGVTALSGMLRPERLDRLVAPLGLLMRDRVA